MARRVIALLGCYPPEVEEQESAVDAITPGHLLELVPTGFQKNTQAGARISTVFALERDELGRDIDTPYAVGDKVKAGYFHPGQRVYAFLASGQNVAKGDLLSGDAVGQLEAGTAPDAIAMALEATDNSAGAAPRVRVVIV